MAIPVHTPHCGQSVGSSSSDTDPRSALCVQLLYLNILPATQGHFRTNRTAQVPCCFTSTETMRTILGTSWTATSTFTQFLTSEFVCLVQVQCCFTSTEIIRIIRDGKSKTATSTFTQFLSSELIIVRSVLIYVHRDHNDYIRYEEPRTATSTFTQLPNSDCLCIVQVQCYFTSTETMSTIRDWHPRTATSTFTLLLSSANYKFIRDEK